MQETPKPVLCPLCKKPVSVYRDADLATRLCSDCRALVDLIRPVQPSVQAAAPSSVPLVSQPSARPQFEPAPIVTFPSPTASSIAAPSRPERPLITPVIEPALTQHQFEPQHHFEPQEAPMWNAADVAAPITAPLEEKQPDLDHQTSFAPAGIQAASAPPPVFMEHHEQSWPLLVSDEKPRSKRPLLLALVLLVVAAAGAGFLYLKGSFSSLLPGSRGKVALQSNRPAQAAVTKKEAPAKSATESQKTSLTASSPADASKSLQATPVPSPSPAQSAPAQAASANGKFTTLQLASFPNKQAADEFAKKAIKAGIPSYIVAAEIPHRGMWYRVRAGKFSSAREQADYEQNWRLRAKSAGLGLQFVPCDYEPPLAGN